jgi:predicted nucleotidyltransferase
MMDLLVEDFVAWARKQPHILAIYLFGSTVEGNATVLSDTDIAILVQSGLSRAEIWKLEEQWSVHWPESLDLRVLNLAPLPFQYEVTARGRRLWAADVNAVAAWESLTWRRYWDMRPRLEQDWQLFVQNLMEKQDAAQREQYQAASEKVKSIHRRVRETAADRS